MKAVLRWGGWLIDRFFQPIANKIADWGFSLPKIIIWLFAIYPVVVAGDVMSRFPKMLAEPWGSYLEKLMYASLAVVPTAFASALFIWSVFRESRGTSNIWLLPIARIRGLPVRIFWCGFIVFDLINGIVMNYRPAGNDDWLLVFMGRLCFFLALYLWACRGRPPAQRRKAEESSEVPGLRDDAIW